MLKHEISFSAFLVAKTMTITSTIKLPLVVLNHILGAMVFVGKEGLMSFSDSALPRVQDPIGLCL